jgi:hypothetical protein
MEIHPDIENEIRVVPLVNLQGYYADYSHNIEIDDLRDVLHALWPEIPERFELLPDAHVKIIDHADEVRTYYVNEEMCKQLDIVFAFLDDSSLEHLFSIQFRPFDLIAVLGRLGVATETKAARARRVERIGEHRESIAERKRQEAEPRIA